MVGTKCLFDIYDLPEDTTQEQTAKGWYEHPQGWYKVDLNQKMKVESEVMVLSWSKNLKQ